MAAASIVRRFARIRRLSECQTRLWVYFCSRTSLTLNRDPIGIRNGGLAKHLLLGGVSKVFRESLRWVASGALCCSLRIFVCSLLWCGGRSPGPPVSPVNLTNSPFTKLCCTRSGPGKLSPNIIRIGGLLPNSPKFSVRSFFRVRKNKGQISYLFIYLLQ